MISETQKEIFAEVGVIKLDQLIPEATVSPARELVYKRLTRAGFWRDQVWIGHPAPDSFTGEAVVERVEAGKRLKAAVKGSAKSALFKQLLTREVLNAARELVDGYEVRPVAPHTQLLFTPPGATEWTVPHNIWHLDVARLGDLGPPGVQMFTFLDTVEPSGGGTLLVAGSHRLFNDVGVISSKEIKRRLKRRAYFRELMDKTLKNRDRFLSEIGYVDDVPLRVVELTGEPGDVYFTDLRLLHSLGPNTSRAPRLMVTQRLPRESVADRMGNAYAELSARRKKRKQSFSVMQT